MRIFSKEEFVNFVRESEYLYLDNIGLEEIEDDFDYDMSIVNEVVNEDGMYGLEFGCRGEVEFVKINNFVEDIIEFNRVSREENEFRYIGDDSKDYLDLNFEEELSISYFIIKS